MHSYFYRSGWDSSCPCFVTWAESQWGQVTPWGQRIARTVSKHLASSMRFKMFSIRAHTILVSEKPSAKSRLQGRDYTPPLMHFGITPRNTRHPPLTTRHDPLTCPRFTGHWSLPTPYWPSATYRRASSGQVVRRPSPLATASHPPPNPHELQDPILYFRELPSATASSRGVGEPGTGAKVAKDRTRPDHGDQALSCFSPAR